MAAITNITQSLIRSSVKPHIFSMSPPLAAAFMARHFTSFPKGQLPEKYDKIEEKLCDFLRQNDLNPQEFNYLNSGASTYVLANQQHVLKIRNCYSRTVNHPLILKPKAQLPISVEADIKHVASISKRLNTNDIKAKEVHWLCKEFMKTGYMPFDCRAGNIGSYIDKNGKRKIMLIDEDAVRVPGDWEESKEPELLRQINSNIKRAYQLEQMLQDDARLTRITKIFGATVAASILLRLLEQKKNKHEEENKDKIDDNKLHVNKIKKDNGKNAKSIDL